MMHADLSIGKESLGRSQKELKADAPKTVKLKFGYSSYVGHYGLLVSGPKADLKRFLKNCIPWAVGCMKRGERPALGAW